MTRDEWATFWDTEKPGWRAEFRQSDAGDRLIPLSHFTFGYRLRTAALMPLALLVYGIYFAAGRLVDALERRGFGR